MTHLTPGAKALLTRSNIVVEIAGPCDIGPGYYTVVINDHTNTFHESDLTPLLTAVVQKDGKVLAEDGRTWEVDWDSAKTSDRAVFPGTTVLGYEKDSKFIIVKIQTL